MKYLHTIASLVHVLSATAVAVTIVGVITGTDVSLTGNQWVSYTSSTLQVNNYRSKVVLTSSSPYSYYLTAARD